MPKKKKPRKGFTRSKKEWEESIAGHIGKAIDSGKMPEYLIMAGLSYAGYEVFKDWRGALFGPICYKLATTPMGGTPPVSQISGVAGLAMLGMVPLAGTLKKPSESIVEKIPPEHQEEFKAEQKSLLDALDFINTVQMANPLTAGLWGLLMKALEVAA